MVKTVQENRFFFLLLSLFIFVGGVYLFQTNKVDAIFFFSENRSPFLNEAFKIVTHFGEGYAYIVIGLTALLIRFRYTLLVAITGITVMLVSFSLKAAFAFDRPMAFFTKQNLLDSLNLLDGVELHSGATSFPSGHTTSAFALYSLLVFLLPTKKSYAVGLFSLALLVGISRIYLVQHFWPDVYAGSILGVLLAMVIYAFQARFPISKTGWWDKSLGLGKRNGRA
ncbi:MAG: phosphatase PAP2 family protein [Saprospiraceae bacterium]|nr:phosphatase PAP2 family protein [Saprospiraceae bacterium]MCF8248357.1 phosphatase PAP2 family protein [Saprospiraceae bacterium]MCF8280204.1 phosphatase PAP2 family protein [Bacteroidales bacterium]MCF8309885.1 phosphatase PAP2 family protein [Saprospiraceae bacterium]MCF8438784.1 phosphatase PAP2 family protein [Saprospiraceae bacterium]